MIRINLLPEKEVKRRRLGPAGPARQVSPLTILIAGAVVALLGGYYYLGVRRPLVQRRADERALVQRLEVLDKEIEQHREGVAELKAARSISESMLEIVWALDPDDRLVWSEKLNDLSDLVPDGVYMTRLTVKESIKKAETFESQRRRKEYREKHEAEQKGAKRRAAPLPGEPVPIFYPEITQTLTIQAIAYSESEPERIRLMSQFYDNLMSGTNPKNSAKVAFMKGFTGAIDYGAFAPRVVGGRNVAEFSFTLETKPARQR